MAKETVYNNTLVSGAADETLTYTRYVKDESSGKSTKELLDEKVNKTDQLGTTQIADKAVTTEKLENESVTTDKLNAASVTTDKVADANITTSKLADSSVETEKINNKAVTTDKLNDGAVDNSKLSPNAVTSEKIKNESIITEKLNDRAVTTEKVEEKAITNEKIGDSAVDGRTISEASVEKKHLANDSVATEKLQDSSVTSDKIHTDAVTEEKIKDSSVSNSKLADNSVGTSKIKDSNITNEKVANNTLTLDKLDPELRKSIQAATGLPENLVEVIQDVDKEVKTLHSKDTDLQSQITDKQQQISAHDKDIELLQTRSTQMEQTINNIAATGGASVANTVAYTNTTSGLESVNAQGAIDELAAKNKSQDATISAKAEKSDVQAAVSELNEKDSALSAEIAKKANDSDVTSKFTEESERVNGELAKKANAEDVSSQMQTEQERVNAEFAKKFDKESILQESGDAEDKVMSQKAVSTKLSDLFDVNTYFYSSLKKKHIKIKENQIFNPSIDISDFNKPYVFISFINSIGSINFGLTYTDNTTTEQKGSNYAVLEIDSSKTPKLAWCYTKTHSDIEGDLLVLNVDDLSYFSRIEKAITSLNRIPIIETSEIKAKLQVGKGIEYETGETVDFSGASITENISCIGYTFLKIEREVNKGLVFFDKKGNKIRPKESSGYNTDKINGNFEIPSDAISFIAATKANSYLKYTLGSSDGKGLNNGARIELINGLKVIDLTVTNRPISNLYNAENDIINKGVDYNTGEIVYNDLVSVSEKINVEPYSFYELSGRISINAKGIVGYDNEGNIIKRSLISGKTSGNQIYGDSLNGTIFTYNDVVSIQFTTQYSNENQKDKIVLKEIEDNIYKKLVLINGGIDYTDGHIVESEDFRCTPLIRVSENTIYKLTGRINYSSQGIVAYDKNKNIIRNPISGSNNYGDVLNGEFYTGTDIKYIRFTCYSSYSPQSLEEQLKNIIFTKRLLKNSKPLISELNGNYLACNYLKTKKGFVDVNDVISNAESKHESDGDGTPDKPYTTIDGTAGIQNLVDGLPRGGKVYLKQGVYKIDSPIIIQNRSIHIDGDSWNYPNDPNGVYESNNGVKLFVKENSYGIDLHSASGATLENIGFQGIKTTGATKGLFDFEHPTYNAGLASTYSRNDQMLISRISSCGLATGFSIIPTGDIDASIFEKLNADGCNIGFLFSPKATYYATIRDSILADCPAFGLCVTSKYQAGSYLRTLTIDGIVCVRNGGGFTQEQIAKFGEKAIAGMYIGVVHESKIVNNQIDDSGTYWNTSENSTKGYLYEYANSTEIKDKKNSVIYTKDYTYNCHGLVIEGTNCLVANNRVNGTKGGYALCVYDNYNSIKDNQLFGDKGILITGNNNHISGNHIKGSCDIQGNCNVLINNYFNSNNTITVGNGSNNFIAECFTSNGVYPKIIIKNSANNTTIKGIPSEYITDNGTNTKILS